jgi:hypothetical protein
MSKLYWAGLAFGVEGEEKSVAHLLNDRIVEALVRCAPTPISSATYADGTEIHYHLLSHDGVVVADIYDRLGTRIGFGIEASNEEGDPGEAVEYFEQASDCLIDSLKIIRSTDDVHIWSWDRDAIPVAQPVMII